MRSPAPAFELASFRRTIGVGRAALGILVGALAGLTGHAQTLYWDQNGSTSGSGSNPNGWWANFNWSFFNNWNPNAAGTSGTTNWVNGRDAVFSAGSDAATSNYGVNVWGTVQPGAITVEDGDVTFNFGTIQFNDGTPDFTVAAGRTATIGTTNLAGWSGLRKFGTGRLEITSANSYDGITNIQAGTVVVSADGALGSSTWGNVVADGANLSITGGTTLTEGEIGISGTGTSGEGAITSLSGSNTINSAITIDNDATITTQSGSDLTFTGSGSFAVNNDMTVAGAGDTTINNQLYGSGSITMDGTGTLTFDGSANNSVSGGLNVNDGTVVLARNDGVNSAGQGPITVGDGSGAAGSAVLQLGANNQIADWITGIHVDDDGIIDIGDFTESINTIGGTGTINIDAGGNFTVGVNSGSSTFGGDLTGTGNFIKTGSGTFTFNNDVLFDGSVFLNGGTLDLNGFDIGFDSLFVGADSVINFGAGLDSNFSLGSLELADGITLQISNWIDGNDLFVTNAWLDAVYDTTGVDPMNQIIFSGFGGNDTAWRSFNDEITPIIPEPGTYGAIFMGLSLAGWLSRRRPRRA
jgi:autotransporter-associated beta strand protein